MFSASDSDQDNLVELQSEDQQQILRNLEVLFPCIETTSKTRTFDKTYEDAARERFSKIYNGKCLRRIYVVDTSVNVCCPSLTRESNGVLEIDDTKPHDWEFFFGTGKLQWIRHKYGSSHTHPMSDKFAENVKTREIYPIVDTKWKSYTHDGFKFELRNPQDSCYFYMICKVRTQKYGVGINNWGGAYVFQKVDGQFVEPLKVPTGFLTAAYKAFDQMFQEPINNRWPFVDATEFSRRAAIGSQKERIAKRTVK